MRILIISIIALITTQCAFAVNRLSSLHCPILGGELSNSAATSVADIDEVMPRMRALGLNAVLVPAYWEFVEPVEGKFDFTLIDRTIDVARREQLHVVFLWFGAWKNSMSCYTPGWFKQDTKRFPRAMTAEGKQMEIASCFSDNVLQADLKAFSALMRHIREKDPQRKVVVMMQIENEIGMLESARDHSPLAEKTYKKERWAERYGTDEYADEKFMALSYARYVEHLAKAAREIHDMPLYVNAAMNSRGRRPGEYPSAGPLAHLIDFWHEGAPSIDLLAPDIYDTGFKSWCAQYAMPLRPQDGGRWFEGGKGKYRKTFATPNADIVKLHFEGVYQKAEVYVNGQKAGQHHYGYTPFTVDVTKYLKVKGLNGKKVNNASVDNLNEVVVKVDNSEQPNCRWYSGSGIYRHVWLETMPALHIAENGVFVTTPEVGADKATVKVEVMVQNESTTDQQALVEVEGQQQEVSLKAGESKAVSFTYTINNPKLWSPDSPYLYTASVGLKNNSFNSFNSWSKIKYGIRSFSFDAENGFVLNGKKVLINGACVHHDDGVLGARAFDDAEIRKVRQMKEAGFNLIRTSHNPTTRAFLDACDSIGMLVIDEAFDGWRTQKNPYDYSTVIDSCFRQDIHAMVLRDRNHPSVISWSIGNEVIERKDIRVVYTARQMKKAIHEYDTTRPVTEALCAWDRDWEIYDPHAEVLDVAGYNYMLFKHASDHERDPKRVIWQTESYPRDAFRNWAVSHDFPYVVGDIVWTGLDYLGESGIGRNYYKGEREGESWIEGGQPEWHGAPCGDVDITGWRKPISHYREMLWKTSPNPSQGGESIYLCVKEPNGFHGEIHTTMWSVWPTWESWTWTGWEGKPIEVEVYTRQPEVKLYLNDQLIDTKQVSRETEFKAVFSVPYKAGTLRAEAGGESVILKTAGAPARLRLTPDRTVMTADGQSLTFVTIEVLDKQGTPVPEAAISCEAIVKGAGNLLAFASADLKDTEPYTSPRVKTWKGRALLVIRSTQKGGSVNVSIKSALPTASLSLKSK